MCECDCARRQLLCIGTSYHPLSTLFQPISTSINLISISINLISTSINTNQRSLRYGPASCSRLPSVTPTVAVVAWFSTASRASNTELPEWVRGMINPLPKFSKAAWTWSASTGAVTRVFHCRCVCARAIASASASVCVCVGGGASVTSQ